MKRAAAGALAAAFVALGAGSAQASQVDRLEGADCQDIAGADVCLFFDADPGEANALTVTTGATTVAFDDAGSDIEDQEAGTDCTESATDVITCTFTAAESVFTAVSLGDGDDTATLAGGLDPDVFTVVGGGAGNDTVTGGGDDDNLSGDLGEDVLRGGDGGDFLRGDEGTDTLEGGNGDDGLSGGDGDDTQVGGAGDDNFSGGLADPGADRLDGGDGIDGVFYDGSVQEGPDRVARAVGVTLDGQANDGLAGEGDNALVEDVNIDNFGTGAAAITNTIVGDAAINTLFGGSTAKDTIDGGGGNDVLHGFGGDDTIQARDGFADRVQCGDGNDTARTDSFDQVSGCESIDGEASSTFATEDRPPTLAFGAPANGTRIATAAPTAITVTAADDKGLQQVVLFDDGQPVGSDTTAPFQFAYQPRGGDVGSNTLTAVAVDSSGQTASAFLTVEVDRFQPRGVTARTTPSRDRSAPFRFVTTGRIDLPAVVTRAQGCSDGVVSVQIKAGSRTISTRRVQVRSNCTYASTAVFRDRSRLGSGRLKAVVRFLGNEVLDRRSAPTRTVRAG